MLDIASRTLPQQELRAHRGAPRDGFQAVISSAADATAGSLFSDYYDTIYKREQQKSEGVKNSVLTNRPLMDRMHHAVGFLLHSNGERRGATHAMMPAPAFRTFVEEQLVAGGWREPKKTEWVEKISQAATYRLVFLTSRVPGKVSFDVRSLQEYMTAERIVTGEDAIVRKRLAAIAPIPYWRNVFLFAAGQCFSQSRAEHLVDSIKVVCDDLNVVAEDESSARILAGSWLALDLLEDGAVLSTPGYAEWFVVRALLLLDLSSDLLGDESQFRGESAYRRLKSIHSLDLDSIFREEIERRLTSYTINRALGAWILLILLLDSDVHWATNLAEACWPRSTEDQVTILQVVVRHSTCRWVENHLTDVVPRSSPDDWRISRYFARRQEPVFCDWLDASVFSFWDRDRLFQFDVRCSELDSPLIGAVFPVSSPDRTLKAVASMPNAGSAWAFRKAVAQFVISPSRSSLAGVIRHFASRGAVLDTPYINGLLPWPLQVCLRAVSGGTNAEDLASRAEAGVLGDATAWRSAEQRWLQHGVDLSDAIDPIHDIVPFSSPIAESGFPIQALVISDMTERTVSANNVVRWIQVLTSRFAEDRVRQLVESLQISAALSAEFAASSLDYSEDALRALIDSTGSSVLLDGLNLFRWPDAVPASAISLINSVGTTAESILQFTHVFPVNFMEQLSAAYVIDPSAFGLFRVLGVLARRRPVALPTRLLSVERFTSTRLLLAAISVRLSQGDWSDKEWMPWVERLCLMCRTSDELNMLQSEIASIQMRDMGGMGVEQMLLAIRASSLGSDKGISQACWKTLFFLQRRRRSGFDDSKRSNALGLPWMDPSLFGRL